VPRPGYDQVVLLTGYPTLGARRLLDEILAAEGNSLVYAVVPQKAAAEAEEHLNALDRGVRERVVLLDGDPAYMDLGLSGAEFRQLTRELDCIHHCAQATYAGVDRRAAEQANVGATREVLELGAACQGLRCLVHHSSAFVAGDRTGTVFEDELERGQRFRSVYEETKARAEKLVRAAMGRLPAIVLRPTNVVGDSTTGAVDRLEGPYLLAVLLLSTPPDVALPMPGRGDALFHVVPIDYVAQAAARLGRDARAVGKTFHLVDPHPLTALQAFELVARAAGRRSPRGSLPVNVTKALLHTPGLERFSYNPRALFEQLTTPVRFDAHNADALLAGTGIRCPPFEAYVERMVAFARERLRERREQRRPTQPDAAPDAAPDDSLS
jgi:thioester reductase-like protein